MADVSISVVDGRAVVTVAGVPGDLLSQSSANATAAETAASEAQTARDEAVAASSGKLDIDGANVGGSASSLRTAIGIDATNTPYTSTGTGAVARSVASILNDYTNSVINFGAVGDGTTNDTVAVQKAFTAFGNRPIFFPPNKTYRLGAVGGLGAAGGGVMGVAGYDSIIKPISGFTGSIFYNQNNATSSSAYGHIHDIRFDLNSENCIAIDLSQCDTFVVDRVTGRGGPNKAGAVGTLVKFGSPLDSSSYNNVVRDCGAEYFAKAVIFGLNANQNRIDGGTFTNNDIAFDCAPVGGILIRPQLIGVRIEDNNIGVLEGAQGGVYLVYCEGHTTADFSFTTDSDQCTILPGSRTRSSATPKLNPANATRLRALSDDFDFQDNDESTGRTRRFRGYHVHYAPADAVTTWNPPDVGYSAAFTGMVLLKNGVAIEGANVANGNTVIMVSVDANNETNVRSYDRTLGADRKVNVGGGEAVRPLGSGTTALGDTSRPWGNGNGNHIYQTIFRSSTVKEAIGTGSPEGAVTAGIGSTFRRTDGGAATSFYVKESGTGNTGWVGK